MVDLMARAKFCTISHNNLMLFVNNSLITFFFLKLLFYFLFLLSYYNCFESIETLYRSLALT